MHSVLIEQLRPLLSEKRLYHCLRVADEAVFLARHWQENEESAYVAGLLHDAVKHLTPDTWDALGITQPRESRELYHHFPSVWHALVGPDFVKGYFRIDTPSILNAIKWHTTGNSCMQVLDQILFLADYIEPGRTFEDIPFIRKLAYSNLDLATFTLSQTTILSLIQRNLIIHPYSLDCRNYYLEKTRPHPL